MEWVNNVAEIKTGKDGGFYLQIKKDVEIKRGQCMRMVKLEDHLNGLVDRGVITSAQADEELEKRGYVKYVLSLAPLKEDNDQF